MARGFSINDILGSSAITNAPAGQKMTVVLLPAADIEPNPENAIYEIGDVSMLKADIAERGLRSPLEVLPAKNGKYMLLAGHRRWTACRALSREGVSGFDLLPCVIHESRGEDDDLIALITSNATARELTDGERLRQYKALKEALERKKAAGALTGRVRDEMSRITGDGTGTLGRLNAILNKCTPEVVEMVEKGEVSLTRAYECSKLYKVQQAEHAKRGYAGMPSLPPTVKQAAIRYLVTEGLADKLKKLDYVHKSSWNYANDLDIRCMEPVTVQLQDSGGATVRIEADSAWCFNVQQLDPADSSEVIASNSVNMGDLYSLAKKLYVNKAELEKADAKEKKKEAAEQARVDENEKWVALAGRELADFDNWPLAARHKEMGLTIRYRDMADGGRMYVAVDDLERRDCKEQERLPYRECFACRYDANGQRVGRDGNKDSAEALKHWYQTSFLDVYIADDLKLADRKAAKE